MTLNPFNFYTTPGIRFGCGQAKHSCKEIFKQLGPRILFITDKGLISLELVLNSQRQYNDSRSQFLVIKRQKINNYLSLILALGGDIAQIDKK